MSRRRHAKRNPISNKTLLIGGVVVAAAVGGYLYWKSKQPSMLPSKGVPGPLPGPTKVAGANVINLTLAPGQMSTVPLTAATSDTLSLFAPTGSQLTSQVTVSPPNLLASPSSGANFEYVAAAPGNVTITAIWTNAQGQQQTSIIPVAIS
jgi:hypothetical protein